MPPSVDPATPPLPSPTPSTPITTRLFIAFLMLAVLALGGLSFWLAQQNRSLKTQLAQSSLPPGSIQTGNHVEPLTLRTAAAEFTLPFSGDGPAVLILHHARDCGYCESTMPVWVRAIQHARPENDASGAGASAATHVRILCIQLDARTPDDFIPVPPPLEHCLSSPAWRARAPMVPSAVLIDARGRVLNVWHGEMTDAKSGELTTAILHAGG